jgi:hypothetical protein
MLGISPELDTVYDKEQDVEVVVTEGPVTDLYPDGYKPLCEDGAWGQDAELGEEVWTCTIYLTDEYYETENGEIVYAAEGEYTYRVTQGDIVEWGTFTDAPPKATLDQCRNGAANDPNDCIFYPGGQGWANGNAGAQTSHHAEGYSIPYRIVNDRFA